MILTAMDPAVPMEHGQDMDMDIEPDQDQTAQFITNCLSSPDILRPILKNFSNNELLKLSLVNNLWNLEVRCVLKARGTLIATTSKSNTCDDLEDLALGLQFMQIIPFSGMNIKLGGKHPGFCKQPQPVMELEVICDEILDQINWRVLAVQFRPKWNHYRSCPGFLLLKKILEMFGSVLQELSLLVEFGVIQGVSDFLRVYNFPNLKTLKFQTLGSTTNTTTSREYTSLIKGLISRAPNLQTLCTRERVNLIANLLEGSRAVHLTDFPYSPALREIPKKAISSIRLKNMKLLHIGGLFTAEAFNKVTSSVLQASCTTLARMLIDAPYLVPLDTYEVSLANVRTLKINFDYSREFAKSTPDVWNRLESFDFTRTFPNLFTVHICGDRKCSERLERVLRTFAGMVDEGRGKSVPDDRAVNVKNLELEWKSRLSRNYVNTFAKMFPNIKRLTVRADGFVPFDDRIYGAWPDLEELDVSIMGVDICLNLYLDTDFCGIFPEELAHLREQEDEYLRRVNIVPVMPSITSLKSLKTLKISLGWESGFRLGPFDIKCRNALFSKVTPLVALKKSPNLTLTFIADVKVQKVLTHLKPYLPDHLDFFT